MNDVTGAPALLLMLLPVAAGLWFWSQSRDMVGLFVLGVCGFVFYSLLTTDNAPAPNGNPVLAMVVFGGFLLVFFLDMTMRVGKAQRAAREVGATGGTAGCMWLVVTAAIVAVGWVLYQVVTL